MLPTHGEAAGATVKGLEARKKDAFIFGTGAPTSRRRTDPAGVPHPEYLAVGGEGNCSYIRLALYAADNELPAATVSFGFDGVPKMPNKGGPLLGGVK